MTDKFLMAGDTALHMCDSQQGDKCIVLLHGYLESMFVWESFIQHLYKQVRVITVDLPGHGISEVKGEIHTMEYLAQVVYDGLRAVGVEKCTVVGHSMGGYVAMALAESHPEILESAIFFSSTPNSYTEEKRELRERELALIKAGKKELLTKTAPAGGFAECNRRRMAEEIEELSDQIIVTEDEGIVAILNGMLARPDYNEILRKSAVRQMFIFGEMDDYIPMEVGQEIEKSHPQAKVVWLKESGHQGFLEQPEQSAEAILNFVNEL